uniref:Uncharacterized protein n=1 Tax=Anguilla anguilla TaxID=7936 RepID=A0A0E9RKF4_ANGAN
MILIFDAFFMSVLSLASTSKLIGVNGLCIQKILILGIL